MVQANGAVAQPAFTPAPSDACVVVENLQGGYGRKQVVFDASFHVKRGEVVSIIGHNGAGKTTTLKTLFGMLPIMGGSVKFNGEDVTGSLASANHKRGMSYIPAERFVFGNLSVEENLKLGALHVKDAAATEARRKAVMQQFPILAERNAQLAGTMSGGQQRMVSLGLALMSGPKLLLLDEPSLGLAPSIVIEIFATIKRLTETEGLSVLILEQNIGQALRIADRFYAMRSGRIFLEETHAQMKARQDYWELF